MEQSEAVDLKGGLARVRRRRWFLWGVFLTYCPAIALVYGAAGMSWPTGAVFLLWMLLAAVAGVLVAFSRCPRCGGLFHMAGYTTSWGGRCVHCQLSLRPGASG